MLRAPLPLTRAWEPDLSHSGKKDYTMEEVLPLLQIFVNTGVRAFDEYVTSSGMGFEFCDDVARLHLQLNHLKRLV